MSCSANRCWFYGFAIDTCGVKLRLEADRGIAVLASGLLQFGQVVFEVTTGGCYGSC